MPTCSIMFRGITRDANCRGVEPLTLRISGGPDGENEGKWRGKGGLMGTEGDGEGSNYVASMTWMGMSTPPSLVVPHPREDGPPPPPGGRSPSDAPPPPPWGTAPPPYTHICRHRNCSIKRSCHHGHK